MKGIITAFTPARGWGFIVDESGKRQFFHVNNSPGFKPALGMAVEFELIPPFRLGQPDQAANLKAVEKTEESQVKVGS